MNDIKFGIVKDIIDPEKLGRAKVSVYGVHDNIDTKDLAWNMVLMPSTNPAKGGVGSSTNLLVGTLVAGIFLDNALQEFLIMGTLPTKTAGVEDNNVRVREEADPHADEPKGTYEPEGSTYAPEYPYNNVMETESGHVKEYDDTPGAERITERHMSGTQYEVSPNGSRVERIVRDNYRLVLGHDTLEVYGNVRIIVSGHVDLAVAGNITTSVTGNMTADVGGNMKSTVEGNLDTVVTGTAKITSTDDMALTSANIKLDGAVNITGNLLVDGTTTTSKTQLVDGHTHAIAWTDLGGSGTSGKLI